MTGSVSAAGGQGRGLSRTTDFFVCDIFDASPKDDLSSMEHPIFSLSTRPDRRVLSYEHNGTQIEIVPSVRGRATIHDKDILIYCISQLTAAFNAGRAIGRSLTLQAHDLLVATNRETSGDGYARLRAAFERLAGTRITTNLTSGDRDVTRGFGLIEGWEIVRHAKGGRMISVTVTLSEWLYDAVMSNAVLTLSREYFRLRKPLERRIYEVVRKHCGRQPDWQIGMATLHKKAGSAAPLRVFRAAMRRMIEEDHLPDYTLSELPGDKIMAARRDALIDRPMPALDAETLEQARSLAPGQDIYALQAQWHAWWIETGQPPLRSPSRAFLGWLRTRRQV